VNDDINVLALIKGKERYIFLYDDSQRAEALRMLGRHASNPELSFSWYDAAVLSQKIRQEERQQRSRLSMPQVTDSEIGVQCHAGEKNGNSDLQRSFSNHFFVPPFT